MTNYSELLTELLGSVCVCVREERKTVLIGIEGSLLLSNKLPKLGCDKWVNIHLIKPGERVTLFRV